MDMKQYIRMGAFSVSIQIQIFLKKNPLPAGVWTLDLRGTKLMCYADP